MIHRKARIMQLRTAVPGLILLAAAAIAGAQGYPNRPVRVVIPFPPGQATDLSARIVAERLAQALGQPFVIVNQPGAGGQTGTEAVTKAAPDGYTLLGVGSGPITVLPALQKVPYDPVTQLSPVSLTSFVAFALVASPAFPANSTAELIATIRAHPDKYTYSSSGVGTTANLANESFNAIAGLKARHVPFNGAPASLTALMGGHVDFTFESVPAVISFINSARLKTFGVSTTRRLSALPEVPTIAESGGGDVTNFDMIAWLGYMAPAGLPAEIANRLAAEIAKILRSPDVAERFRALGMEALWSTPAEMAATIRSDTERYGAIAKKANIKIN